ncbi:MAG: hypothetical protein FJ118_14095 [Deltaproteobacteria bacterium]|nr:hypothetical protein [Deltaproteobacteria bacterium]
MESKPPTIQVRYCGGCNPEIDRSALVSRFVKIAEEGGFRVDVCDDSGADWLLLVNGCPRACLEEERPELATARRRVSVEGSHVGHQPVSENDLPGAVWKAFNALPALREGAVSNGRMVNPGDVESTFSGQVGDAP